MKDDVRLDLNSTRQFFNSSKVVCLDRTVLSGQRIKCPACVDLDAVPCKQKRQFHVKVSYLTGKMFEQLKKLQGSTNVLISKTLMDCNLPSSKKVVETHTSWLTNTINLEIKTLMFSNGCNFIWSSPQTH